MRRGRQMNRLVLGAVSLTIGLTFTIGVLAGVIGPQMFSGGGRQVTAVFANVEQLKTGDEVRVAGVLAGAVNSIHLKPGGRATTVKMDVAGSAGPLYRDATATIAWKTVLGGAYNINVDRGHPGAGALDGATIPISHTADQVTVDDVLSFDKGAARRGLQQLPGQLSVALSDHRAPARLLNSVADVAPSLTAGIGALRGQAPDSDLRSLVTGAAATMRALNAPNDGLRGLVQGAAATLGVTAARAQDLQHALDAATPAMRQTQTTFAELRATFSLANPLLRTLSGPVAQVGPTVSDLYPTVLGARDLLQRAVPLLHALPPALRSLAGASRAGLPLLEQLTPSLTRLQNTIVPYLNTVNPATQRTTAEMIGPTTEALGPDIAGQMDQNGHFIRFPATGGSSPLYLPCQTYLGNPSAKQLIACESLQQTLAAFLGFTSGSSGGASGSSGGASASSGAAAVGAPRSGASSSAATPSGAGATGAGAAGSPAPAGALKSILGAVGGLTRALLGGGR